MKQKMMTMIAAVLICAAATAQDKQADKRPEKKFDKQEMIRHRTNEDVKRYGLNDKQAADLLELNTKYADKMGGPRHHHHHGKKGGKGPDATTGATPQEPKGDKQPPKDGKKRPELTPEQKAKFDAERKEREANRQAYESELKKIMTSEQFESWQADQKKHRHHHRGPGRGPAPKK